MATSNAKFEISVAITFTRRNLARLIAIQPDPVPISKIFNGQTGHLPAGRQEQANGQTIIVAGGIGVAPLFFLAERLKPLATLVLIGAKTKDQILCKNDFKKLGCDVRISTDDGSAGLKGKVTDLLRNILRNNTINANNAITLYACGPELMLKEIRQISKSYDIPAQVSLEAHMACGFGACLGCAVDTQAGYKLVCKDGPVFNAEEILW